MRTRSTTRRAKQPSALCTEPSVGGCCSSDNSDSLLRNSDDLNNCTKFACSPPYKTGGSLVLFQEKRVPYKINNCHLNHNCRFYS